MYLSPPVVDRAAQRRWLLLIVASHADTFAFHRYRNPSASRLVEFPAKLTDVVRRTSVLPSPSLVGVFSIRGPLTLFPSQQQIVGFNLPGDVNQPLTDA
jgi:hypothetical protein